LGTEEVLELDEVLLELDGLPLDELMLSWRD
jgi:hypothetical protein